MTRQHHRNLMQRALFPSLMLGGDSAMSMTGVKSCPSRCGIPGHATWPQVNSRLGFRRC